MDIILINVDVLVVVIEFTAYYFAKCDGWRRLSAVILFAFSATEITTTQTWAKANSYFLQNSFWKPYSQK